MLRTATRKRSEINAFCCGCGCLYSTKSPAKGRRMPDMTPAPRRRPLWRLFIMPALVVIAALAWSAFWFYAASEVGVRADAWAAQEAKSGRVYACGKRDVAGFPFRFEVRCSDASVSLFSQTADSKALFT